MHFSTTRCVKITNRSLVVEVVELVGSELNSEDARILRQFFFGSRCFNKQHVTFRFVSDFQEPSFGSLLENARSAFCLER